MDKEKSFLLLEKWFQGRTVSLNTNNMVHNKAYRNIGLSPNLDFQVWKYPWLYKKIKPETGCIHVLHSRLTKDVLMVGEWNHAISVIKQEPPVRAQERTNKLNAAVFKEQVCL